MDDKQFDKKEDINVRLNKLYGVEEIEIINEETEEEPIRQMSDEEAKKIRKQLTVVLAIVVVACAGMLFFIFSPMSNFLKNNNDNDINNEDIIVDDNNDDETEEEIDQQLINKLSVLVSTYVYDSLIIDNLQMYNNEVLNINDKSDEYKMFLLLKSEDVKEYLETNYPNVSTYTCQEYDSVVIDSSFIQDVGSKYFGESFSANVATPKLFYNGYLLTLTKDEGYKVSCTSSYDKNVNYYISSEVIDTIKTENGIELYQRVVFINQTGVYKDPKFSELITNDASASYDEYFSSGSVYKYTFENVDDNYHLKSVELSKGSQ